jgi:beta-lactamase regulating signal transducer with metallopeptidase domain
VSAVFLKVLNMGIAAGWAILAVVLARFLLKKAPRWISCLLWALAAVRLLCPFSPESALSLLPSGETVPLDIAAAKSPAIHSGITALNSAVNPAVAEAFTPGAGDSANPLQILIPVLAVIWLAGAAAMLAYALFSYGKLRRLVSASVPLEAGVLACDEVQSPFILGLWRPRIYVPSGMTGETLACVLTHERAHLRRRDHWWKPLGFLLLAVYWFQPLCWLGYVLLCRDIEAACDERVIRDLDREGAAAYSQALLDCSFPRRSVAACPLAFGETGLKQRVKGILNYKKPAFWVVVAALILCAAIAVCFLTDPKEPAPIIEPSGRFYRVEEIVCVSGAPRFQLQGFAYTMENVPRYCVTAEYDLLEQDRSTRSWRRAGTFGETELSKANFDALFWGSDAAPGLRRNNQSAWVLVDADSPDIFYYLLLQKSGEVYLAYGYWDYSEKNDPHSDDTLIRYVFALAEDGTAVHGPETAPPEEVGAGEAGFAALSAEDPETLREKYPEYFGLSTFKGLEVYVWQMAEGSYSWGLMEGTNREKTNEELWNLRGTTTEEMRLILSSYDIPEENVFIQPIQKPWSSFIPPAEAMDPALLRELLLGRPVFRTQVAWAGYSSQAEQSMISSCLNGGAMAISSVHHIPVIRLSSPAELEEFQTAYRDSLTLDRGHDEAPSFLEAVAGYDEAFFADHSLMLAYVSAASGSYRYALYDAACEGGTLCMYVTRTNDPETYTSDRAGWLVLAEVPDSALEGCGSFDAQMGKPRSNADA